MWAIFAALTSILAKVGIEGVNSNLATAIRTIVVVLMAWFMVFITGNQNGIVDISKKSWIFLILSGLATGASWLCYYKAYNLGKYQKLLLNCCRNFCYDFVICLLKCIKISKIKFIVFIKLI